MAAAERGCARATTVARRTGHLPGVALTKLFRAVVLGRSGRLCDAVAAAEEAREVSERLPPNAWMPTTASFFRDLSAQHLEPDWERMAAEHWRAATSAERVHWYGLSYAALAGLAHARGGEEAGARHVAGQIMPAVARALPCEPPAQLAAAMVAEIAWVLRDPALAASVEPHVRRLDAGGVGDGYMTLYELTIARLRALQNDLGGASRAFQAARERLDAHGERPLRAIVDFDEALARAHRAGSAPSALVDSARARFAELGMTVWEGRAAELAARTAHAPSGLSKRETEVLRLLATGMTNRQIADALVVSVHTVERHVNNLYRKIGARNRADAAAFAVRSGL
jgi:DNA-binding CsgD family transcriptional regulator